MNKILGAILISLPFIAFASAIVKEAGFIHLAISLGCVSFFILVIWAGVTLYFKN